MAKIGYGTILKVGATFAAITADVSLAQVTNVPPPSMSRDSLDVTSQDSPDFTLEFIPGMVDPGEMSFDINWEPGNATDDVLLEMFAEQETRLFSITFTQVSPNRVCQFRAFLKSYEPSIPTKEAMTNTLSLQRSGPITWSDVA